MRSKRCIVGLAVLLAFFSILSGILMSQFPKIPKIIPDKIPGLDKILKQESPITNKLSDAVTEVPFLDDFDPEAEIPMTVLPRTDEGGFVIKYPGAYVFFCQSYCLHAGAYEPGRGDGYLFAPVKGPQADIFTHIVQRSVEHPVIPQRDVQVLLWAILARTKISDMAKELQVAASKLLTPKEIFEINGGALELVPKEVLEKATIDMPPQVRRVMEAEASLRNKLSAGEKKYEELEEIAVRHGVAPMGEGSKNVPRGRWSYREEGYFVRYFPTGYSQTQIELYAPEPLTVERDDKGRILVIVDKFGNRIETEYDESVEPLTVTGEPSLKGYAFSSIRIECYDPESSSDKKIYLEWKNTGWTFYGVPTGKGEVGSSSARFPGLEERYKWIKKHKEELEYIDEQFTPTGEDCEVLNLGNYAVAIKEAVGKDLHEDEVWKDYRTLNIAKKAWASALSRREHGYSWSARSPNSLLSTEFSSIGSLTLLFAVGNPGGEPEYDPSGDAAMPGNTASQRLLQSGKGTKKHNCKDKALKELGDAIDECFLREHYDPSGACDVKNLIECCLLYPPPDVEARCIGIHCKHGLDKIDPLKTLELRICIENALKEWKKKDEKCK
jgi:hypothetical protein